MQNPDSVGNQYKIKALALLVALTLPHIVQAQATSSESVMPEIKVTGEGLGDVTEGTGSYTTGRTGTATPLNMSLRDTPQSVSVVTQQRMEDEKLLNITDVLNSVTGVFVNQYETSRAQFTARGFDINTLMIDGVPTTWDQAWSSGEVTTSLAIYDRVEVVRGATGLTTGAGDPSAAVNLVRKRANSKNFMGAAEVGIGSWNERRGMVDLSTPVNQAGTVRARVVGEYRDRDSWIDKLENKNTTLFATFEADLTPGTLLSGGVSRQDSDADGSMWGGLPVWYSDGTRTNWSRSKTTTADWVRWDSDVTNYFAALEHRFGNDWKVKATYNKSDRNSDSYLLYLDAFPDRSTGLGMTAFPGSYKVNTKQDDIGLQASGPFELLGRKHELSAGYTHSKQKFDADSRSGGTFPFPAPSNFNTWDGSYAEPAWGPLTDFDRNKTTQEALYGAARFNVTDPLKVILGARVTNYKRTSDTASIKHDNEFTPYAGLVYDLNANYSVYGSYTDIFRPQQERSSDGSFLDPVKGKSAEVGIKGEFMDGRLNASAAVFRIKQDNLAQATGGFIPGTTELSYREAEGATSKGFELEVSGELATGWNASVGYSKFIAQDAEGRDINSIYPRQLLRLFTTYRLPGEWNQLTVGGGVNWQGKTYTIATNPSGTQEKIKQDAYPLVNLMARYEISKQLSAQLNINNLLDEEYYNMFAAYHQFTYGAPRNAMLSMNYKF